MDPFKKKNILLAPLDWGLGHTTRCIPIIYELISSGFNVIVAGNNVQIQLLRQEFPLLTFIPLEGYNVQYSKKKSRFLVTIARQLPGIARAIKKEHQWLKKAVHSYQIDGIISDNRFGLYHKTVPSVFITHQLNIQTPFGRLTGGLTRRINYSRINKFTHCWIPDFKEYPGLAGVLSHPPKMPAIPCNYIGPLSRMQAVTAGEEKKKILILLSGPEPQRTLFEQLIFSQLRPTEPSFVVVRGLPNSNGPALPELPNVVVYDHLPAAELNRLAAAAAVVVCRSGYSTIMDLCVMAAKAIMVPTPGQTEQEYLAGLLAQSGSIIAAAQDDFDLYSLLERAQRSNCRLNVPQQEQLLKSAVRDFADKIRNKKSGTRISSP
ncbi:MAG: glycosyl transferase family 28 [Niabella sp.]|nr:glycosyl transferase family 28 [Niabella sp.]